MFSRRGLAAVVSTNTSCHRARAPLTSAAYSLSGRRALARITRAAQRCVAADDAQLEWRLAADLGVLEADAHSTFGAVQMGKRVRLTKAQFDRATSPPWPRYRGLRFVGRGVSLNGRTTGHSYWFERHDVGSYPNGQYWREPDLATIHLRSRQCGAPSCKGLCVLQPNGLYGRCRPNVAPCLRLCSGASYEGVARRSSALDERRGRPLALA